MQLLGPVAGSQACGETGDGRMWEPLQIREAVTQHFSAGPLCGAKIVLTAGPTREPIDPVRYISNRSSGKMGYALAEALPHLGARSAEHTSELQSLMRNSYAVFSLKHKKL